MLNRIYLDHNATTPLAPKVLDSLKIFLDQGWGNPSSIHWAGRKPKQVLRETRKALADFLKVHPLEIIFTSGATEANNTVLQGLVRNSLKFGFGNRPRVITSSLEHPSISETLQVMSEQNLIDWVQISVDQQGNFDFQSFEKALSQPTLLVSVMTANNETGFVLPIQKIMSLAKAAGAFTHSDATQAMGKIPVVTQDLDYLSLSAHKMYALKGCGVLWVKKSAPFEALILGGAQERSRRAGTENILGVASLGMALAELNSQPNIYQQLVLLRDRFESQILSQLTGVQITHQNSERLPNTSHLIIDGIDGESLLMSLDLKGYAVSTGAACSSGSPEPSPVLLALGFTKQQAQQSLRVSFGLYNTSEEVDVFVQDLISTVNHLRKVRLEQTVLLVERSL